MAKYKELFEDGSKILELCNRLPELYVKTSYEERAKFAGFLASNYTFNDATLYPSYRRPFSLIAKGPSRSIWLPIMDEFRNWLYLGETQKIN